MNYGINRLSTRRLVYMAFLIALSIILTRFLSIRITLSGVEGIRIGIGGLPIIFAGIVFGPLAGGIVGALSDFIGVMFFNLGGGAFMPHFTLTAFLTGFIPGLIVWNVFRRRIDYFSLLAAIGLGQLITSIILVPLFLQNLFGVPLVGALPPRIITQLINIPLYSYLIKAIVCRDVFAFPEGESQELPCR
ncbi:MAG: folate family ECF transporter S component [Bacillota bacterium]